MPAPAPDLEKFMLKTKPEIMPGGKQLDLVAPDGRKEGRGQSVVSDAQMLLDVWGTSDGGELL